MGWRQHAVLPAVTRIQAQAVWKVIVFILESLIFILIGLSLRGVVERLGGDWHSILKLLLPVAVVIAAVIVTRFSSPLRPRPSCIRSRRAKWRASVPPR